MLEIIDGNEYIHDLLGACEVVEVIGFDEYDDDKVRVLFSDGGEEGVKKTTLCSLTNAHCICLRKTLLGAFKGYSSADIELDRLVARIDRYERESISTFDRDLLLHKIGRLDASVKSLESENRALLNIVNNKEKVIALLEHKLIVPVTERP